MAKEAKWVMLMNVWPSMKDGNPNSVFKLLPFRNFAEDRPSSAIAHSWGRTRRWVVVPFLALSRSLSFFFHFVSAFLLSQHFNPICRGRWCLCCAIELPGRLTSVGFFCWIPWCASNLQGFCSHASIFVRVAFVFRWNYIRVKSSSVFITTFTRSSLL